MNTAAPTLDELVDQLRANAATDVQLAQRVAMACCVLIETNVNAIAAIRTAFRIKHADSIAFVYADGKRRLFSGTFTARWAKKLIQNCRWTHHSLATIRREYLCGYALVESCPYRHNDELLDNLGRAVSKLLIASIVYAAAFTTATAQTSRPEFAKQAVSQITLPESGEVAGVNNPPCINGDPRASDILLQAGAKAIDVYVGGPVASTIVNGAPKPFVEWLKVRMGAADGRATCASACVVVPPTSSLDVLVCMSENNGSGQQCSASPKDLDPPAYARFDDIKRTKLSSGNTLICADGKNWSHNLSRQFWVHAFYN